MNFTPTLTALIVFTGVSPIISIISRRYGLRRLIEAYAVLALAYTFYTALTQYGQITSTGPIREVAGDVAGVSSIIYVDLLSIYVALIFVAVGLLAAIFSIGYIEERRPEFYPLLLALVTGMVGVSFSGDLVTFFIFWEMMSIASYLLVAFRYRTWEAVEASFKYLIMSASGTAAILFGISLMYGMAGTLEIEGLRMALANSMAAGEVWSYVSIAFLVTGFGVNAAMVPFHSWLPDAHPAAPSSISAMLSGVVIKTGVYAMFRILTWVFPAPLFDWRVALAVFAVLTMTVGNLLALLQEDIKRLLAYSSIAHIGYIVFGLSIATASGIAGGLFHVLNHALIKALLFLGAGALIHATNTRSIEELSGIGRRLPLVATCFAIGLFALAGIPGLNVFWSEFTIVTAGLAAGSIYTPLSIVMVVNILISVAYYLRLVQAIFFKPLSEVASRAHGVGVSLAIPLIVLAAAGIVIGVYPTPFLELATSVAASLAGSF
ncbi:NADH-quinone oxidoreductase subunit N [archaeon HR01]|nr:NADH-quinone oxidoreductase subunit N [archaeon HR01]